MQNLSTFFPYFPDNFFLVGGSVRDYLLNRKIKDFDFVVNTELTSFQNIASLFVKKNFKKSPFLIGKEFPPTMRVVLKDGKIVDITYLVENFQKDAIRRDFTINAIYLNNKLEVIDPLSGVKDIELRKIQVCSEDSFKNDPLRLLRAIRFLGELEGFKLTKKTFLLLNENSFLIIKVAFERIREELEKIFLQRKSFILLKILIKTGLLFQIIPELKLIENLSQRDIHKYNVLEHSIMILKYLPHYLNDFDRIILSYVALLHDLGKKENSINHEIESAKYARKILKRLKLSNKKLKLIVDIILNHMKISNISFNNIKETTLKKLVFKHYNIIDYLIEFSKMEASTKNLSKNEIEKLEYIWERLKLIKNDYLNKKDYIDNLVNGNDIVSLGIKGADIGKYLKKIKFIIFRDNISNRDEALKVLKGIC